MPLVADVDQLFGRARIGVGGRLLALLNAEEIDITLFKKDQLDSEKSTSSIVIHNPRPNTSRSEPAAWRFPCKQRKIPLQLLRQGWKTCLEM